MAGLADSGPPLSPTRAAATFGWTVVAVAAALGSFDAADGDETLRDELVYGIMSGAVVPVEWAQNAG